MTKASDVTLDKTTRPRATLSMARLATIAAIGCATLIPIVLVSTLVDDREGREAGVRREIARSWGPPQTVWGPTLVVPVKTANAPVDYLRVAPETLDIKVRIVPEERRRGLFAAPVYAATVEIAGAFKLPSNARAEPTDPVGDLVALSVSGTAGIEKDEALSINGEEKPWQLCRDVLSGETCNAGTILVAPVDPGKAKTRANGTLLPFSMTLHLHGSEALRFSSTAKQTTLTATGGWRTPSYVGDLLPIKASTSAGGFEAVWRHDEIGEPRFSQGATLFDFSPPNATMGVELIEAMPVYRTIVRATKYSPLIVALSFATYFLFELVSGIRITPLQYALLGASLSLFTLLLLAVSEILGYPAGYTLSAGMVLVQATAYTASVGRRLRPTAAFAAMLAGLFGFLYVLLGLESYALVVGAVALFIVLSIIMGVTQQAQGSILDQAVAE